MANFQIVIDQLVGTETVKNVTYWQLPDNQALTVQTFADNLRGTYVTHGVAAILSSTWTLNSITVRQMDGGGAFSQQIAFALGTLAGSDAADLLPYQNALLVSTGFLGAKPNRGRIYFGGLTEGANAALGTATLGVRDAFEDMVETWRDGVATGAGNAFLRIARPNFTLNNWTLNNPVESVVARVQWATQRRRRPGVGV